MSDSINPTKPRGVLSLRRFALLATTVAGLGAAAVVLAPDRLVRSNFPTALAQNVSQQAQTAQRPVGFADIVETREARGDFGARARRCRRSVSMQSSPFPQGSPMDRFFRRLGAPEGEVRPGWTAQPDRAAAARRARARSNPPGGRNVTGQGSGFFISADGYAVTNNHVVDRANNVQVTADDGRTYTARVIGTDPRTDLALIKVDGRNDFPLRHAQPRRPPRIGDWVLAVGNPFGLGGTVTAGIVSATGRDIGAGPYDDFIQIDAPVNRGNSGGPTFDVNGNVIGVNTAIFSPSGGNVGIAFAIPASTVPLGRRAAARARLGDPRMDRRADPAGHGRDRRQPQPEVGARRAGRRAAGRQPGGQGRHPRRRHHHPCQRHAGPRCARARPHHRRHAAEHQRAKLTVLRNGAEQTVTLTLGELPNQREARVDARYAQAEPAARTCRASA